RRGLDRLVSVNEADDTIGSRILIQIQLRSDVPEQMQIHRQAGRLGYRILDLDRQSVARLVIAVLGGKEPGTGALKQQRAVALEVKVVQGRRRSRKLGFDADPVLDRLARDRQMDWPTPAPAHDVPIQVERGQVAYAQRHHEEDLDAERGLDQQRCAARWLPRLTCFCQKTLREVKQGGNILNVI